MHFPETLEIFGYSLRLSFRNENTVSYDVTTGKGKVFRSSVGWFEFHMSCEPSPPLRLRASLPNSLFDSHDKLMDFVDELRAKVGVDTISYSGEFFESKNAIEVIPDDVI